MANIMIGDGKIFTLVTYTLHLLTLILTCCRLTTYDVLSVRTLSKYLAEERSKEKKKGLLLGQVTVISLPHFTTFVKKSRLVLINEL